MSRSHRRPENESNGEAAPGYYHVVCHDCRVESLETDADEARDAATRHDEKTGHDVTVGRL
ncbi:hypothetical protein [Halopelagius inordinatus]|nr:hypothetical protein [Halopelagius inordinatus]